MLVVGFDIEHYPNLTLHRLKLPRLEQLDRVALPLDSRVWLKRLGTCDYFEANAPETPVGYFKLVNQRELRKTSLGAIPSRCFPGRRRASPLIKFQQISRQHQLLTFMDGKRRLGGLRLAWPEHAGPRAWRFFNGGRSLLLQTRGLYVIRNLRRPRLQAIGGIQIQGTSRMVLSEDQKTAFLAAEYTDIGPRSRLWIVDLKSGKLRAKPLELGYPAPELLAHDARSNRLLYRSEDEKSPLWLIDGKNNKVILKHKFPKADRFTAPIRHFDWCGDEQFVVLGSSVISLKQNKELYRLKDLFALGPSAYDRGTCTLYYSYSVKGDSAAGDHLTRVRAVHLKSGKVQAAVKLAQVGQDGCLPSRYKHNVIKELILHEGALLAIGGSGVLYESHVHLPHGIDPKKVDWCEKHSKKERAEIERRLELANKPRPGRATLPGKTLPVSTKRPRQQEKARELPDIPKGSCAAVLGKPCSKNGNQCGTNADCLLNSPDGTLGVCTCRCTPDNPRTPLVNEETCPGAKALNYSICGAIASGKGPKKNYCFKRCSPRLGSSDCQSPIFCNPRSGAVVGKPNLAVCYGRGGCTRNSDCPVSTGKPCDTRDAAKKCTGAGEKCKALTAFGTVGMCAVPGVCDTRSGLCDEHRLGKASARVGDPCKSDLDCAGNQRCMVEFNEARFLKAAGKKCTSNSECCSDRCKSGVCAAGAPCRVRNRNGYCTTTGCQFSRTLTIAKCDTTSACNRLFSGGICQRTCNLKLAKNCRGLKDDTNKMVDHPGDYECRAWNNISIGGRSMSSKPVCDFGNSMPCDKLSGSGLDCSSLGLTPNVTNMKCRGTNYKARTNKYDPAGLCLDDTAPGFVAE